MVSPCWNRLAHEELSWLFHEPHTGLVDRLRNLLSCFRARTSAGGRHAPRQASAIRLAPSLPSKRCHFRAWRRGVFDTLVQTHSLTHGHWSGEQQSFFVWVDTVLNCLSLKFGQVSPPSNPKHAPRNSLCNFCKF